MNEIIKNILTRRSIRKYQDKQIKLIELQAILEAGSFAPSGMNKQSWKFTAIHNKKILKEVNETIRQTILMNENNPYYKRLSEKARDVNVNFLYNASTYVLVSNSKTNYNSMADSALAIGNMMLAAHSLGIGSCWLNQLPRLSEYQPMKQLLIKLAVPKNHVVYGSVVFGYPDEIKDVAPRSN